MNIKKSIIGSLFSMLLVSEMAAADWGDVYYCQMTNFNEITLDGKMTTLKPQTFKFNLDKASNSIIYGDTGYFKGVVAELIEDLSAPEKDIWRARSMFSMTQFIDGKLLYSLVGSVLHVISADCDKF